MDQSNVHQCINTIKQIKFNKINDYKVNVYFEDVCQDPKCNKQNNTVNEKPYFFGPNRTISEIPITLLNKFKETLPDCPICLSPISYDHLSILKCEHPFHMECLNTMWTTTIPLKENVDGPRQFLCPMCRSCIDDPVKLSYDAANYYKKGKDLYTKGLIDEGNQMYKNAYKMWETSAMQGNPIAQCNLATLLEEGHGCIKNSTYAVEWFTKAAKQGLSQAEFNLGVAFSKGRGVIQNKIEAERWFNRSANNNNKEAQYTMGVLSLEKGDVMSALHYYHLATDNQESHPLAAYNLALLYDSGRGMEKPNKRKAVKYFIISAEKNIPQAQHNLAYYYEYGVKDEDGNDIISIDTSTAFMLYLSAAEKGHAESQYSVALCYDKEIGVVDSDKEYKSIEWLKKAAIQMHPGAIYCIGIVHALGSFRAGIQPDQSVANAILNKAVELGCKEAENSIICPVCGYHLIDDEITAFNCGHRIHNTCIGETSKCVGCMV
jgi:TPR repeat protein